VIARRLSVVAFVFLCCLGAIAQEIAPVRYGISLEDATSHVLHVRVSVPRSPSPQTLRLPVWNALYQVRDFAQYVTDVHAADSQGHPLTVTQVDKSSWTIPVASDGVTVQYDVAAVLPGPYGAEANAHHVFLNLAEVLMYLAGSEHARPVAIEVTDVPKDWKIATVLHADGEHAGSWTAPSYDAIADAPLEIGEFREIDFQDGRTRYRIAIDADAADYDPSKVRGSVERIVRAETDWMDDQPCSEYLFIYHFPHGSGGGGMEHACSTAISVSAERMADGMTALESVTAHEFFHQWNVKRIRPQSLEPIDYTREQYTRALWFSEGVTSTVEGYMTLKAGLATSDEYLAALSSEINTLQNSPAHRTQSAEDSSLDAWLEKYPYYRRPERSISYYNKGEILGVMLDLAVRDATGGAESLRDVLQWMNDNFAKKQRFFSDSDGVRAAVEAVTKKDFSSFFARYVSGTAEIPYDDFLATVGFRLRVETKIGPDAGFASSRNFDNLPSVSFVQPGSEADRAGLKQGDIIAAINSNANANLADELDKMSPGDTLKLDVRSQGKEREVKIKVGSRQVSQFTIVAVDQPTAAQLARRTEWLRTTTPSGAAVSGDSRR
jgi:predicted metalloprotease with PDZ domain